MSMLKPQLSEIYGKLPRRRIGSMALDRLKALETYLESCSNLSTFPEILEQQCVQLTKELQNLTTLDFEEGAPLLAMVQQK